MGVHLDAIHKWELGQTYPTIKCLSKIISFLGFIPQVFGIDKETIAGRVYHYRLLHGLSRKEFGEMVGLEKSTIGHVEQRGNMKDETQKKLESLLCT